MSVAHQHDDVELNLSAEALRYLVAGETIEIDANRLAVFWAARPHQLLRASTSAELCWATIPLATFLSWNLPASFVGAILEGQMSTFPVEIYGRHLPERFAVWASELRSESAYNTVTAALELEAICRRIAAEGGPTELTKRNAGAQLGAIMAEFISDHAADEIGTRDIAAHVHLHPQYAMTLFRNQIGTTMGEYLLQCRVSRAQRLLVTSDEPVPQVGFTAGFQSQSQFYDRFRRAVGDTPSSYRRTHTRHPQG